MKLLHRSLALATVSLTALMALGGGAQASSFYIRTGQSAEGLGMQFAGGASGGIGIGSIGWNPATITMFPGRNSNWNATYILPQAEYDLQFTNVLPSPLAGPLFGTPLGTGDIGGNGAFAPASYSAFQINDWLWLGLATGAPFGLSAKPHNYNFAGQVYGRSARIKTINVAPTVGYKVTDWLSIGAAAQFQYLKVNSSRRSPHSRTLRTSSSRATTSRWGTASARRSPPGRVARSASDTARRCSTR